MITGGFPLRDIKNEQPITSSVSSTNAKSGGISTPSSSSPIKAPLPQYGTRGPPPPVPPPHIPKKDRGPPPPVPPPRGSSSTTEATKPPPPPPPPARTAKPQVAEQPQEVMTDRERRVAENMKAIRDRAGTGKQTDGKLATSKNVLNAFAGTDPQPVRPTGHQKAFSGFQNLLSNSTQINLAFWKKQ